VLVEGYTKSYLLKIMVLRAEYLCYNVLGMIGNPR